MSTSRQSIVSILLDYNKIMEAVKNFYCTIKCSICGEKIKEKIPEDDTYGMLFATDIYLKHISDAHGVSLLCALAYLAATSDERVRIEFTLE